MILRVLNLAVICALVLAAAYVYRIKFDSTVQAERLAKMRSEVRHERDRIAALRAEWGQLDNPGRIEGLAKRYLKLRPIAATQFDKLDRLPDRPPGFKPNSGDPIGSMIETLIEPATTGSVAGPPLPPPMSSAAPPTAPYANAPLPPAVRPPTDPGAPGR